MEERPRYTTIIHKIRIGLELSCNEYCVADIIYHLSNNPAAKVSGWCYASKEKIAEYMGLTRRNIQRIIIKLETLGLVEKDSDTKWLKTTTKWYEAVVIERLKYDGDKMSHSVTKSHSYGDKKSHKVRQNVSPTRVKTTHNIYKDNNKDINRDTSNGLERLKTSYPTAYQKIQEITKQQVEIVVN